MTSFIALRVLAALATQGSNLTPGVEPPVAAPAAPSPAAPAGASPAPPAYETTVTALRLPRPLPDVPSTVTVLPREELERTPALGMDELVRLAPAATTFRRTPSLLADPTSQGLSLRAVGPSGVSRALVLVDGVPANDPFGGWIYWRALPRLGLDRIELVPGGSSALYGNYALGGVVQLAGRGFDPSINLDLAAGSLRTASVAGRAAGRLGRFGGATEFDILRSSGYVPVAAAQRGPIDAAGESRHAGTSAQGELQLGDGWRLGGRAGMFVEDQNGGTRLTTAEVQSGRYAVTARRDPLGWGGLDLAVSGSVEHFDQTRPRIAAGRSAESIAAEQKVRSHGEGASAVYTSRPLALGGSHQLLAGSDLRHVAGTSTEALTPAMPTAMAATGRRAGGEQDFLGLFVQDLYAPADFLELSAAVRADWWRNRDGLRTLTRMDGSGTDERFAHRTETELSPRLGVLLRPSPRTRVRGSVYQAFRAPNLNELYRPFQVGTVLTASNEQLRSERLSGAELGVEGLLPAAGSLRVTGFVNLLEDPIANVTLAAPLPDGSTRQRQNLGRVTARGVDVTADARLPAGLNLSLGYTLAQARVTEAPAQPDLVDKDVPQAPRHRARAALGWGWRQRVETSVQLRMQSRSFEDDLNMLPMGRYAVIDAYAGVAVGWGVTVFGSVQNLLDERYLVGRAGVDTIGPPLLALAGVRLR
jgi:outer membrane receptor protein involved in Fe transport